MNIKKNSQNFLKFRKFQEKNRGVTPESFTKVNLLPVSLDVGQEGFQNVTLLYKMLPVLEAYHDYFDDDTIDPKHDYDAWIDSSLDFVRHATPWFFIVTVEGQPQGVIWAANFESFGSKPHAVEVGGLARRKVNPRWTQIAIYQLTARLFDETPVRIVRLEFEAGNRAVRLCGQSVGFSHLETRRCLRIRRGEEIPGQYLSMTRREWEAFHHVEEKEKE